MMERLIGSFLTTQKHTNNFYKHTLTHHSLLTAVHQFHCAGFLSISQKRAIERSPSVTFSLRILVISRHWVSLGVRHWGYVEGYVKKNKVSLEKIKKSKWFEPPGMWNKWVWKFISGKILTAYICLVSLSESQRATSIKPKTQSYAGICGDFSEQPCNHGDPATVAMLLDYYPYLIVNLVHLSISTVTCAGLKDWFQEPCSARLSSVAVYVMSLCLTWQAKDGIKVNKRTKQKAFRIRFDCVLQLSWEMMEILSVVGTLDKLTAEE